MRRDEGLSVRSKAVDKDEECRAAPVAPSTLNQEGRTVNVTAATETPVPMYDWARDAMVPEILLMDGVELPESRSVPLLDSHSRYSTSSILGSAENLRVENRELVATARFSSTAEDAFTKVREGHLKDLSVGYKVLQRRYIAANSNERINGREFAGPVNVVTKWSVREVSFTPIGADQKTKVRGKFPEEGNMWFTRMVREFLESRGMPVGLDVEKARDWLVGRGMPADCETINAWIDENEEKIGARKEPDQKPLGKAKGADGASEGQNVNIKDLVRQIREEEKAEERAAKEKLRATIEAECKRYKLDDMIEDLKRSCEDEGEVHRQILDRLAKRQEQNGAGPALQLSYGREQTDKFADAVRSALTFRTMAAANFDRETHERYDPENKRAAGWQDFRGASFRQLAEEYCRQMGHNPITIAPFDVAAIALGYGEQRGFRSMHGFHTTGSFVNVTLDAMNKTLIAAYSEYPSTWQLVGRQGSSVRDFKNINRVRLSDAPNIEVWNGYGKPNEVGFRDEKESYVVECRSNSFSFDYKSIINDDMNAFERFPSLMGVAMKRTVNASFWAVLTTNPTMQDGQALFSAVTGNRFQQNLTTGAGAPAVATLQTLSNLMMQMKGANQPAAGNAQQASEAILGLVPKYIIGPSALSTTIKQLVNSIYDPADGYMKYNTASDLTPVIEPLLDANSTTAWYLSADPRTIDTIEVTFLQGQEQPITRTIDDMETLSKKFIILQTWGTKAIDFRGLQKHAGA